MGVCPISSGPCSPDMSSFLILLPPPLPSTHRMYSLQLSQSEQKFASWSDVQNLGCVYINI